MNLEQPADKLSRLFNAWAGKPPREIIRLAPSGSERAYYRLQHDQITAVGAWHPVAEENKAFTGFSRHFRAHGLPVPEIYLEDPGACVYLQEDLGDITLLSLIEKNRDQGHLPEHVKALYKMSLEELVRFQVVAGKDLDYTLCYPDAVFDHHSMIRDLHYFKYYFLKLHAGFHEARLEDDFTTLANYLARADANWFMYRDFQARNILVRDGRPWFIDFQGGRKGPLQYDVASLLFQVKAKLPAAMQEEMLGHYLDALSAYIQVDKAAFREIYDGFVLIRLMQVLGAYGYRGLIQRKPHFLASIPPALNSLSWWLENVSLPVELPELMRSLENITKLELYSGRNPDAATAGLTLHIHSFSYRNGLPADLSGHGGGFVFDCRALPNPGREEQYRAFNGRDKVIIDYLENKPEVGLFLKDIQGLVSRSLENYLERGFGHLSVSFGCTGGQHRSVYCAEKTAAYMQGRYPQVTVDLQHHVLNNL